MKLNLGLLLLAAALVGSTQGSIVGSGNSLSSVSSVISKALGYGSPKDLRKHLGNYAGGQVGKAGAHEDLRVRGGGDVDVESQNFDSAIPGPTVKSSASTEGKGEVSKLATDILTSEQYKPQPVDEGPLAETMRLMQIQERALLVQASRCRAAVSRMAFLQKLILNRAVEGYKSQTLSYGTAMEEISEWKSLTKSLHSGLSECLDTTGRDIAGLLGEKPAVNLLPPVADEADFSSVSPPAEEAKSTETTGPSVRGKDGNLVAADVKEVTKEHKTATDTDPIENLAVAGTPRPSGTKGQQTWNEIALKEKKPSISPSKDWQNRVFSTDIESKYRVSTFYNIPVYGAVPVIVGNQIVKYEYPEDTELHLVWDVDQSKLVGEGTNDVELVIKCVLWWKEELSHDPNFIPKSVPPETRKEFKEYCDAFDLEEAFEKVVPLLVRPGAKQLAKDHPQAKWWTFTNKDREVDGQIVRDVSDEDGLVGTYQSSPHEVSGRKVIDANKYALQVLDRVACKEIGVENQARPLIGVRGQRKDMGRIARLIKSQRKPGDNRPVTIVLIDDRKCDAWGKCQTNDPRNLCHIQAYNALPDNRSYELIDAMESILPVKTLLKFYKAFCDADPTHALVQCVDIMSDDQSMLLKKKSGAGKNEIFFDYIPKTRPASQKLPGLASFVPEPCK